MAPKKSSDQKAAEAADVNVYVIINVGSFVVAGDLIAYVTSPVEKTEKFSDSIVLGDLRSFDQDLRFGLLVMGEMASKALSQGINDAGTAIDVITRLTKVLAHYPSEIIQQTFAYNLEQTIAMVHGNHIAEK